METSKRNGQTSNNLSLERMMAATTTMTKNLTAVKVKNGERRDGERLAGTTAT
jgi:hypothetical protein